MKKFQILSFVLIFLAGSVFLSGVNSVLAEEMANYVEKHPKIIGGYEASPNAWPFMAILVESGLTTYYGFYCGGALINPNWVLTAAHCVEDMKTTDINVVLGIHDLNQVGDRFNVKKIVVHPQYDSHYIYKDIALIQLDGTAKQEPVPIYEGTDSLAGEMSTVLGWGGINADSSIISQTLQQVEIPIVSNTTCSEAYLSDQVYFHEINEYELCAGLPEGGKDSCKGDSGGPLLISRNNSWKLAGVVSYGWQDECGSPGTFGVYARVSKFSGFIHDVVDPDVNEILSDGDSCFISTTCFPGKLK